MLENNLLGQVSLLVERELDPGLPRGALVLNPIGLGGEVLDTHLVLLPLLRLERLEELLPVPADFELSFFDDVDDVG